MSECDWQASVRDFFKSIILILFLLYYLNESLI